MKKRVEDLMVEFIRTQADDDDIYTLLEFGIVQTPRICEAIVERNPIFIDSIENQTPELCLKAISNCHNDVLEYVFSEIKVRTPEVCMEAVKRDSSLVFFMENPSDELWLTAIDIDPEVLSEIVCPSYDLCLEAVKRNPEALKHIQDPYLKREIKKELKPRIEELIQKGKERKGTQKVMEKINTQENVK